MNAHSAASPGEDSDDANDGAQVRRDQADERTRLLPNPINRARGRPLLTPDDPAVSPYNLWTVRVMRSATVFLTVVSLVWWALLLVSLFSTPPGLHTRGSGFFALSNASIASGLLVSDLFSFGAPSKSIRLLCGCIALALLVNTILTLAVQMVRYQEGWVGTVSVLWAFLMSLWVLLADRTVEWGKAEEEERLTGHVETRRTISEWSQVLISTVALFALCLTAVLMTMTLTLRSLDAGVGPPGELYWVDASKYRIHIHCEANVTGSAEKDLPTVLLEGGDFPVEHGLWQLATGALRNGSFPRFCFVDRPGFAWSDTAPSPLSAGMEAAAMGEALAKAGERGPWVIASAGVGSFYSRVFASQHGGEVKGLLLIDPLHDDDLDSLGSARRGLLFWLWGILSPLGLDTLPEAIFGHRRSVDRIWGISAKHNMKHIFARLQESLVARSFTKREVAGSREILSKDTPLAVVSSGKHLENDGSWEEKQRDLTRLTEKLHSWDVVDNAPHRVWETREGRDVIEQRLSELVQGVAGGI